MPIIGTLSFDVVSPGPLHPLDNRGIIYATGTTDKIGTAIIDITRTITTDGLFLSGGYTCYLPEGAFYLSVGGLNPNPDKIQEGVVRGLSGNFLNAFGTYNFKFNLASPSHVEIAFYDVFVYPLS